MTDLEFWYSSNCVLGRARDIASWAKSWTEFSEQLFHQKYGYISRVFCIKADRQRFFYSEHYNELEIILLELMKRVGIRDMPTFYRDTGVEERCSS